MHIGNVKTAIKIGEFILHPIKASPNYIKIQYSKKVEKDFLKNN